MKIYLDTNILLDVLLKREQFYQDSMAVLNLCKDKEHEGWINLITVANLFYIGTKFVGKKEAREVIETLVTYLQVTGSSTQTVIHALNAGFDDFEDGLQYACAIESQEIEAIITRNAKDYKNSSIPFFSPAEFLKIAF